MMNCFRCNFSYWLLNSSYCNILCSSSLCGECDNDNASLCLNCSDNQLIIVDGLCVKPF